MELKSGAKLGPYEILSAIGAGVQPGAAFAYAKPQLLFDATNYVRLGGNPFRDFDVSADGKRFLMLKGEASTSAAGTRPSIVMVSN